MNHALYGVNGKSVDQVGRVLSTALSVEFEERESDYIGIYLSGMSSSNKIRINGRFDAEGEPLEPDYPEWDVFIYLDGPERLPLLGGIELEDGVICSLRE